MDLPKCKICGEKHRLGPCPQSRATNPVAKATKGKAGTAEVDGLVRRSTAGTGLRVGEAVAVQPTTSEIMDVTSRERPATNLARGEAVTQRTVNAPIAGSNPAEPAKKPFDRNEAHRNYMRDYMRRRRQAEKQETEK